MTITRARRWLRPWLQWFERHRLYRAYPDLAMIDEAIAAARRTHRSTTKLVKQRREIMAAALKGGLRHG